MTDDLPKLLSLSSMARCLRVSPKWLRAEAEANRVPHLRAGNQLLFARDAVEAAMLKRAAKQPPEDGGAHHD